MTQPYDIAIVGGGMVGASLAVALAPLDLRVALIEAVPHDAAEQPSFDERTTALSNGSRQILTTLGVWPDVAGAATPIRKIHVSDQGRFGFARIDAEERGLAALGYVLPNRVLGRALWSRIETAAPISAFCPATVTRVTPGSLSTTLALELADGSECAVEARLVVAADGARSALRSAFGVGADSRDYRQTALITALLPQRFHEHVAYERFTPSGPIALLPLADGRCTLVFTVDAELAATAMSWSDAQFLAEVQQRFGFRLGRFLKAGRRAAYPLRLTHSERTSAGRCAIVGNAAQGLHPVAGMGFNLGLRDVASLAELIAEEKGAEEKRAARGESEGFDAGSARLLGEYDAWRAEDRRAIIAFTDGLVRVFGSTSPAVRGARNFALLAFDLLPPAKAALQRLSTGASRRIPKLARGVALR